MIYRPDWWPTTDPQTEGSLLAMCERLHMDYTGSSDPLHESERDLYIRCLVWCKDNWRHPSSDYDWLVLEVIGEALREQKARGMMDKLKRQAHGEA